MYIPHMLLSGVLFIIHDDNYKLFLDYRRFWDDGLKGASKTISSSVSWMKEKAVMIKRHCFPDISRTFENTIDPKLEIIICKDYLSH